jgi:tetratricopeptide (TPR) repeat protein
VLIALTVYSCVALAAFGSLSTLQFELDDLAYLGDLKQIGEHPGHIFSAARRLPGRPVTDLALLVVQMGFPNDPAAFHIALVLGHCIAVLLLVLVFHKMGLNLELSLLAGLLFLVNVAHFRAVQWISCLAYPLALGFGCAAILFYTTYLDTSRPKWLVLSLTAFLLALLSHPAAVIFPVFLGLVSPQKKWPLRPILMVSATCFALLVALIRLFPEVPQTEHATAAFEWEPIGYLQHAFWYLGRVWTSAFYVFPGMSTVVPFDLISGILALLFVCFLFYFRSFPIAHWGLWMLLSLAVFTTNPNQTHFESGPSRHLYFASAGSAALLAWVCQQVSLKISDLTRTKWMAPTFLALCTAALTLAGILGLKRSETFAYIISARTYLVGNQLDAATDLFERGVHNAPDLVGSAMYERFPIANLGKGRFLTDSLQQGLAQYPDNAVLVAIGMTYGFQSDTADAQHLTEGIIRYARQQSDEVQDYAAIAFLNLGFHFLSVENVTPAGILFEGALQLKPDYPEAATYLSQIALKKNDIAAARQFLNRALNLNPQHIEALVGLADLFYSEKNWEEAERLYQRVLTQLPRSPKYQFKLAYVYMLQNKFSKAREVFESLTRANTKSWQYYAYLGQCYHAEGKVIEARQAYALALKLKPDLPEIRNLLQQLTP